MFFTNKSVIYLANVVMLFVKHGANYDCLTVEIVRVKALQQILQRSIGLLLHNLSRKFEQRIQIVSTDSVNVSTAT